MTEQATQAAALEPRSVRRDEGEARWWFGALAEIKASAADTWPAPKPASTMPRPL